MNDVVRTTLYAILGASVVGTVGLTTCEQIRANNRPIAQAPLHTPDLTPRPTTVDAAPPFAAAARTAGRIACGETSCTAGKEVCCAADDPKDSWCADATVKGPCAKAPGDGGERVARATIECDDATGCGGGRACCEMAATHGDAAKVATGGGRQIRCVAATPGKRFPCDFAERCVEGTACRTEGARCEGTTCAIPRATPSAAPRCGSAACDAGSPACCWQPGPSGDGTWACADACLGPDEVEVSCRTGTECPRGEYCGLLGPAASCMHWLDPAVVTPLCGRLEDCPPAFLKHCYVRGKNAVCESSRALPAGLRRCACR